MEEVSLTDGLDYERVLTRGVLSARPGCGNPSEFRLLLRLHDMG